MDNINDILASDLLERYALGEVSPEEKMKVDMLLIDQVAIRARMRDIESTVEQEALDNAVTPPDHIRSAIVKQLHPNKSNTLPSAKTGSTSWSNFIGYAAALVIGAGGMWFMLQSKLKTTQAELVSTTTELEKLITDCEELSDMYAFTNDGATRPMLLTGEAFNKEAEVVVYWNQEKSTAMLRVVNLPAIKSDQTYQLWADVDGEMLDLGVFDAAMAIVDPINIGYLSNATSLNITIEPSGGSKHPTVSTLTASRAI